MELTRKKKWLLGIGAVIVIYAVGSLFLHGKKEEAPKIAVIRVEGVIVPGESGGDLFSGQSAGADTIMRQLRRAGEDKTVKAVLMRIDSPGGSAAASQEISEEMMRLKDKGKPIVISMADMAASGGYWLAAEGDTIYANPATITGSIGVYIEHRNLSALYDKLGIVNDKIKSGPLKDMMASERPLTEQERNLLQAMVNDMYNQFLEVVVQGRHMTMDSVKPLADGRIFTGRQAKDVGLVDHLGNYYDALSEAATRGGIKDEVPNVVEYTDEGSLWDFVFNRAKVAIQSQFGAKLNDNTPQPRIGR